MIFQISKKFNAIIFQRCNDLFSKSSKIKWDLIVTHFPKIRKLEPIHLVFQIFQKLFIPKIRKIHISRSSLVETIKERAEKFGKVIIEEGARCEKKKVCGAATGAVSQ